MSEEVPLTSIKGVGPKTSEKLIEKGITSTVQLATKRPEEIAELLGITKRAAKEMVNDAKVKALDKAIQMYTHQQILERKEKIVKKISTGSLALDKLLKGGVCTEAIWALCGEYSVGKTQLCMQLAVNTIKMGRKVVYIETESGCYQPDRLNEIAKASNVEIKEGDIYVIPASQISTPYNQYLAYELIDKKASENNIDLGLIIVDSFTAKMRSFFAGREMLPLRSQEEARHLGFLDILASKYNCAVVLTVQVMDVPDTGLQIHQMMKTGTRKELVGGNVLKHGVTYVCMLQKVKADEYELRVVDAPNIPFESVRFRVSTSGIRDITTR